MFYSLENDDYDESCFQEKFPLLKAIKQKIQFEYPESKVVYDEQKEMMEKISDQLYLVKYFKELEIPVDTSKTVGVFLIYTVAQFPRVLH